MKRLRNIIVDAFSDNMLRIAALAFPFVSSAETAAEKIVGKFCLVLKYVYTLAIVIGIIYAIIAGWKYMTSGGDTTKVSEGHKALTWVVVGLAVAIVAAGVPKIIAGIVGGGDVGACTPSS